MLTQQSRKMVVLLLILLLLLVTACSSNATKSPDNAASGATPGSGDASKAKVTLHIARSGNPPAAINSDNPAEKYVEDKIGATFNFDVYAPNLYEDKMRVQISGGDIPDAFVWNLGLDALTVSLIQAGKLAPLDDYIDKYPGLKALAQYNRDRYQGKTWAIATVRNPVASSDIPLIRQDWLDNLHLKAPTTLDEMMKVATAFTNDDPDQDGKKDTYGIQISNHFLSTGLQGTNEIKLAFGLDNNYMLQNGKYVPMIATPQYKQYLAWMQQAYKAGVIDPDFTTTDATAADSKVTTEGRAGIMFSYATEIYKMEDNLQKKNPKARLVGFAAPTGPSGARGISARISPAGIFITKAAANDPAKMSKIMEWLNWGATDEANTFINFGVEGVDYTKDASGTIVPNNDAVKRDMPSLFSYTVPLQPTKDVYIQKQYSQAGQDAVLKAHLSNEPYIKYNDTLLAFSSTQAKYSKEIQNFLVENESKAILGQISVSQWDQVVQDWYKRFEGDKIIGEIAAAMSK